MEPFSILCKSCAARLKVTKASAVGQILACPKCGTMIQVDPPDGWVAPPTDISSSQISHDSFDGGSAGNLGGNFEDIEHILAKPQRPAVPSVKPRIQSKSSQTQIPKPQSRRAPAAGRQPNRQPRTASADQVPPVTQPVLPNEQWTSDSTRKRKRIVTAIAGVLGTLLLLAAIGAAVVFNLSKPKPDPVEHAAVDLPVEPEQDIGMLNEDDLLDTGPFADINNNREDEPLVDVGQAPRIGDAPPVGGNVPPVVNQAMPNDGSTVKEPAPARNGFKLQELSAPDAGGDVIQVQEQNPEAPPKLGANSPFANKQPASGNGGLNVEPPTKPDQPTGIGMVEAFDADLGDLSSLLEASGTSILDFKDLTASIRTQQLVGVPKYIIAFPDPAKLDMQKQLEIPIGGILYDGAPLARVIQNLSAITGIPITIDAPSIAETGKASNPTVSVKIANTNLDGALRELLSPLGLTHIISPNGVSVGVFPPATKSSATFELPNIPGIDEAGKNQLIAIIQVLVEPESWARTEDPATISLTGNQIEVNCTPNAQTQIQLLLSKLKSAFLLVQNPDDETALNNTQSRWKLIQPGLGKNPDLSHSVQMDIGSFLTKIQQITGVTTVVDWQHLIAKGWTPQTIVPGNIIEPTVEETVTELARALDMTFVAVDDSTLMITTFEQAAQMVNLEVYPIGKLVPDRIDTKLFVELVTESLGSQLQSERVRYTYEPNCRCLIVSAPQQIQRQIEALIDRLQQDLVTPDRRPVNTQQATN